ncbi:MAG: diaminopimelate decarboxylase [Gammaproteobacteria bacterium]|jgi:diaminopimelate decarboxylase|nr:diaminopimelate decarboxylase [Gammaproteobacteria bacterium]
MDFFQYHGNVLHAEGVPLDRIAAEFGTPTYVYSRATLERHWHAFDQAFAGRPHLVCYAVKANGNLGVLNALARLESGFDIVSLGELERVLAAGGEARRVVFSGVGKRADEMRRALELGIRCFNVESVAELERLNRVAEQLGRVAPVSLRVNPDVDAGTHPYISTGLKENKFGVDIADAPMVYRRAAELPGIEVTGVDFHIGSQLTSIAPFLDALDRVLDLVRRLGDDGIHLRHIDIGGGLGVRYRDEAPPEPADYAAAIEERLRDLPLEVLIEPGRAIAANAGVLLTRVEYLKPTAHRRFAIVDAAMNDLIRPALYEAFHDVVPVRADCVGEELVYDLVGPVCESADFLAHGRPLRLSSGDLLALRTTGAYGFCMASNYNGRPRAAEVMVDGDRVHLVRRRETCHDLYRGESVLP